MTTQSSSKTRRVAARRTTDRTRGRGADQPENPPQGEAFSDGTFWTDNTGWTDTP